MDGSDLVDSLWGDSHQGQEELDLLVLNGGSSVFPGIPEFVVNFQNCPSIVLYVIENSLG